MHAIPEADLVRLLILCRRFKWEGTLPDLDALESVNERVRCFLDHVMPAIDEPGWEEVTHSRLRRQLLEGEPRAVLSLLLKAYAWDPTTNEDDLHLQFRVTDRLPDWYFCDSAAVLAECAADYNTGDLVEAPFIRFGVKDLTRICLAMAREILRHKNCPGVPVDLPTVLHDVVAKRYVKCRNYLKRSSFDSEIQSALAGCHSEASGEKFYISENLFRVGCVLWAPDYTDEPQAFIRRILHAPQRAPRPEREAGGPDSRTETCIDSAANFLLQMVEDGYVDQNPSRFPDYLMSIRGSVDLVDVALACARRKTVFASIP